MAVVTIIGGHGKVALLAEPLLVACGQCAYSQAGAVRGYCHARGEPCGH